MESRRQRACIATEFETGTRRANGLIRNISERGVFVGSATLPAEGERVSLRFRAPGGHGVTTLSGRVSWTTRRRDGTRFAEPPGFGIRLAGASKSLRRLLDVG